MPPPSDPRRFYDLNYVRVLLRMQLGLEQGPRTAEQEKVYREEWRLLIEQYKGLADILNSLAANGLNAACIYSYCQLAATVSQRQTGFMHIMRLVGQVATTDKAAANYLIQVAKGAGAVSPKIIAAMRGSAAFLAVITAIGCIVHISRGDWPRALGDIAKTALSLASAPGAFVDLIFSIIEAVLPPNFASGPFWRLFKTGNVLQVTATAFETVCGLAWCLGVAVRSGNQAFMAELDAVMSRLDRSPLAVWTELGQGFAVCLTTMFPSTRNWGIGYATLGNLVNYADQNRTLDSWY